MKTLFIIALLTCSISCDHASDGGNGNAGDSVKTDSLQNPSFNPGKDADSAVKQMNLDSTNLKDSIGK